GRGESSTTGVLPPEARGGTVSQHDAVVDRLARERGRALVGYAYLLTWDSAAAEDLVQEALVRTYARSRRLEDLWAAEAYVRRTMLNLFLDTRRRGTRWSEVRHLVARGDVADDAPGAEETDVRIVHRKGLS